MNKLPPVTWMQHRFAQIAHGFIRLKSGKFQVITSLCGAIKFTPGDMHARAHHELGQHFTGKKCEGCKDKEENPLMTPNWPTVKCPHCEGKAILTDSTRVIICKEACDKPILVPRPLYAKEVDMTPEIEVVDG